MNVSLTPQLEAMVRKKVESGRYASSSEVIRDALRIMEQEEAREQLRTELRKGTQAIEEGRTTTYTPQLLDALKEEAERRWRAAELGNDIPSQD
ncbi:MAG: type II toxin-antitoxin system ParD family antitoxin [Thermomicrobiales bacterium]|nr:type II toxin-antitoxin system ParD family antitoxin [Thermomicrobiales bacterium]